MNKYKMGDIYYDPVEGCYILVTNVIRDFPYFDKQYKLVTLWNILCTIKSLPSKEEERSTKLEWYKVFMPYTLDVNDGVNIFPDVNIIKANVQNYMYYINEDYVECFNEKNITVKNWQFITNIKLSRSDIVNLYRVNRDSWQ